MGGGGEQDNEVRRAHLRGAVWPELVVNRVIRDVSVWVDGKERVGGCTGGIWSCLLVASRHGTQRLYSRGKGRVLFLFVSFKLGIPYLR